MDLVQGEYRAKRVFPLANAFATDVEFFGDRLTTFAVREGVEQPSEPIGAVALDEVAGDFFATVHRNEFSLLR